MTKTSIGVQELRKRIGEKAKADSHQRFWGLGVMVGSRADKLLGHGHDHVYGHDLLLHPAGCSGGKCALAVSYCIQTGDVCFRGTDCCSGSCKIAAGRSAGVCTELATTGSGSCAKDGTVCQDCTNRLCESGELGCTCRQLLF
jgi:hypothetical protein